MAFSANVKQELCRQRVGRRCCAQAEAYGILLFCSIFHTRQARIVTECSALKERLPVLFHRAFQVSFDQLPETGEGKGAFLIEEPGKLKAVFDAFDLEWDSSVSLHINLARLEEEHCRTAFLRGVFLAGGSVTDPMKGYHLEMATSHYHVGRELPALLREAGFEPKETDRKGNRVIYFKQSDHIEDYLTFLGAPVSAMEVMAAKIERDLRGSVNRQVNCDSANLDKTVAAAREQLAVIERLQEADRLDCLPDKLKEAARLRMEHPELNLSQLAALCDPPVSKSALNHRMRKLVELAGSAEQPSAKRDKGEG
ncbi:MAG: DNA-binding protein WhiA [Oscillospiraceae bacterium]|nr:DNA-binding protein WhiA [Oscillospiraceae bacterium]